jgi:8-hydroxy-5-deazaflavin:NADPH oxidoreductase
LRYGILGTGMVGRTIGGKLVALGHDVMLGSRTADNPTAGEWMAAAGDRASRGTYAEAAAFGEIVFNCTKGDASLDALRAAGADHLAGKVLVDVANPLDFSRGMPPSLFVGNTDSLGETIQRAFPRARVVKTLNTVNADLMVDPGRLAGTHTMFVCGDDADAKATITALLRDGFGWPDVIDLGDLAAARATEAYLHLWLRLWRSLGTLSLNVAVIR